MRNKDLNDAAQALSVRVFHKVAARPGYEPVDEDTAIALVCAYANEIKTYLKILDRFSGYGPQQGTRTDSACAFCDMGEAGYSTRGDGFHDDKCAVKDAQVLLADACASQAKESSDV